MSGTKSITKHELEALVISNGATVTQNPTKLTRCVIAETPVLRVKNIMKKGDLDVLKPEWIQACVCEKRIIPARQKDVLFATTLTQKRISENVDEWGDSYTEEIDEKELREVSVHY